MINQTLLQELNIASNDPEKKEQIILDTVLNTLQNKDYSNTYSIISNISSIWPNISTARITKIIKKTIDNLPKEIDENILFLLQNLVDWSNKEGRKLLKLDLEVKKVGFLLIFKKYKECLENITRVLKELKKFDDKENQIRLYVYESKAYYELNDSSRARSAMTSARALAVSSYCSTDLQAQIDLLSGMFVCDENQHSIAYSYFLESLDGFIISKNNYGATLSVRYLILSKIMDKKFDEINVILKNKPILPFLKDEVIIFFLKVKEACKSRNLKDYQEILTHHPHLLVEDTFIKKHLTELYNILFENNILKIIEPYSNLKIEIISKNLNFSVHEIEEKLRKMILDGKINGIIDNANHSLILYERKNDKKFNDLLENIEELKCNVNSL